MPSVLGGGTGPLKFTYPERTLKARDGVFRGKKALLLMGDGASVRGQVETGVSSL